MTPQELQEARRRLHLSQSALAALLGIHPQTLSKYERGDLAIPGWMPHALAGIAAGRALTREG